MYVRKIDNSPYYIGIGDMNRPFAPHKHGNIELKPKDDSQIIILESNLTFDKAKELEKYWIAFYGRKDNGTGILRNRTDGGEGTIGIKKSKESLEKGIRTKEKNGTNKPSAESIAKRVATRKANNSYALSEESKAKRKATILAKGITKQSPETIAKRVASIKSNGGYTRSPEAYAKAVETKRKNGTTSFPPSVYSKGWETRKAKLAATQQAMHQPLLDV
jgi:hypothetical protein